MKYSTLGSSTAKAELQVAYKQYAIAVAYYRDVNTNPRTWSMIPPCKCFVWYVLGFYII